MFTRMYIIFIKHDNVFLIAQQIADILIGKFYDNSVGKESICNAGDPGWIPGLGRCTGERIGHPLQYSWVSLVAQTVKNPSAMQETRVQ